MTSVLSEELKSFGIHFYTINNSQNLSEIEIQIDNSFLGLSFEFGVIFPQEFIERFKNGIINIHPGSFAKYRGRHAIQWALLEGEKEIEVTCHLVEKAIDAGKVLHLFKVEREMSDNVGTLSNRILTRLLSNELPLIFENLKRKKFIQVVVGPYRQKFSISHEYEELGQFNYEYLHNLFKTQESYSGILYRGKRFFNCTTIDEAMNDNQDVVIKTKDNILVKLT